MIKLIRRILREGRFNLIFVFDYNGAEMRYEITDQEFYRLLKPKREKKGAPLTKEEIALALVAFFKKLREDLKPYPDIINFGELMGIDLEEV